MKQSRRPDEILIVDNNRTDKTVEISRQYTVRIVKESRRGIWAARATGFSRASGEIIVRTDADVRFPLNWLQRIENEFIDADTVAVSGPGKFYDGSWLMNKLADHLYMRVFFWSIGLAMTRKPLFGSNYAMRMEVWNQVKDEVHSSDESVYDDIDLSYHLLGLGEVRYNPALFNYISIRPLKDRRAMLGRYKKGYHSTAVHWPEQSPRLLYEAKMRKILHINR